MILGAPKFFSCFSLALLISSIHAADAPKYADLARNYSLEPPKGFVEFCAAHNNPKPNTCAIRLSVALHKTDPKFFDGVTFPAGYGWKPIDADRELATRAASLSKIIIKNWGEPKLIKEKSEIAGQRGLLFFDTIRDSKVTGHVSLWDGNKVLDGGDYFEKSTRIHFWPLE
ncbi:MAG TPA: T6SS effector amidase Tae4 family protein [Verrucomicrobiae bacterium]